MTAENTRTDNALTERMSRSEKRLSAAFPVNLGDGAIGLTRDVSASGIFFETDVINEKKVSNSIGGDNKYPDNITIGQDTPKGSHKVGLCDDFKQINLFNTLGRQQCCLIFRLWEIIMLNESLLILADSPIVCRYLFIDEANWSMRFSL